MTLMLLLPHATLKPRSARLSKRGNSVGLLTQLHLLPSLVETTVQVYLSGVVCSGEKFLAGARNVWVVLRSK